MTKSSDNPPNIPLEHQAREVLRLVAQEQERCRSGTLSDYAVEVLVHGINRLQANIPATWRDSFQGLSAGVGGTQYEAEYESSNFPKTEYVGPVTVLDFDGTEFNAKRHPGDHSYYMAWGYSAWTSRPTWRIQLAMEDIDMDDCITLMDVIKGAAPHRPAKAWTMNIARDSEKGLILTIRVNLYWPANSQ